jgi:predicted extracellular nuclease
MKKHLPLITILLMLLVSSCRQAEGTQAAPLVLPDSPAKMVISRVQAGVEGNNQADFIELYNAGTEIADLKGYSLWYQLNDSSPQVLLIRWDETALVPPLGFYALALKGQVFSIPPDAYFSQSLVPNRGGLSLRKAEQVVDQLCWGTGPLAMSEGDPAPAMDMGSSLGRRLGEAAVIYLDNNDNKEDFQLMPPSGLQNSGSPLNLPSAPELSFNLDLPTVINPGSSFFAELAVDNQTNLELHNLKIHLSLPDEFSLAEENPAITQNGSQLIYSLPELKVDGRHSTTISLLAEYTFEDYEIKNSYLEAENWPLPAFTGPIYGTVGGGPIPIATARTLIDKSVIVEGISTMYVGGFYAGSGAKFYLEDDTAGIQIYVAGAGSSLVVPIGATLRVKGKVQIYRDSLELVPVSEDDVEIIASPAESAGFPPALTTIEQINAAPDDFPGMLVEIEGQVAGIEEFSYSFEMDLFDDSGNMVSLYLDKDTGITVEEIEADQFYRVTGIIELYDGNLQLYPRLQSDLSRVYPPGLNIQVQSPTTVQTDAVFQVIYLVTNHSPDPDRNLIVSAAIDPQLEVLEIQHGGYLEADTITWEILELDGGGGQIALSYTSRMRGEPEFVSFGDYSVLSQGFPEPASGITSYTFSGDTVPIWAVQGTGSRSPYILSQVSCQGVVTGVFPGLEGFWMQDSISDADPSTSPGIFVNTGAALPDLRPGDVVQVSGRVRESYQQTELEVTTPSQVSVLSHGLLPQAVSLDPPVNDQESALYYEALEGALVTVPGPAQVIGPSTAYGEFALVLPEHGLNRSWQNVEHGMLIHVDDGRSLTLEYRDSLPASVAVGDFVFQLTGPLAFTYGNYKIEPIADYRVENQPPAIATIPPAEDGEFSLMTWNAENLFDFQVPHPSSPPLPSVSEYKRDISKVAQTIQAAGYPTVVALQEVENLVILEDIAAEPLLTGYGYQAYLIEGTDSRGIDVGYLVRGDRAQVVDAVQYPAPGNITSRPPLLLEISLSGEAGQSLYLLNNHFTSMSGGEQATEPRRTAQAAWNLEIAQDLLVNDPDGLLAIMGDLNSYYASLPLDRLEEEGFKDLFDYLEPEERYTYNYQGLSQVLDHILVNGSLDSLLIKVEVLHCNADYPLPSSDEKDYIHKSDHDPVVATFAVP